MLQLIGVRAKRSSESYLLIRGVTMNDVHSGNGERGCPVLLILTEHDFDPEPDLDRQKLTVQRYSSCLADLLVPDDTVVFLHTATNADLVKSFFLGGLQERYRISFLSSHLKHGSAGLLKLLPLGIEGSIALVCVADFRRELDIPRLVNKHISSGAKLSIVTAMPAHARAEYEFVIGGGGAVTEVQDLAGPLRKTSVGVYLISADLIDIARSDIHMSMTEFFLLVRGGGYKVLAIDFEGAIGFSSS